jgi:hypothetical protein
MAVERRDDLDTIPSTGSSRFAGAEAAMHRAAIKARHRALQTTGSYPIWENGEIVYVTEIVGYSDEEIREVLGESAVTNIGGYVRPPKPM